ncbi:MAG: hypothetical protein NTV94_17710 [Planctomycetota bacterium]|nr:hypothetical protein [Planctomycetota bacterium]
MRNAGRMSSWDNVEADLATGVGTLIVDRPCVGGNDANVWWTRESLEARALSEGISIPRTALGDSDSIEIQTRLRNPAFDRWCQERFFDVTNGQAVLVQSTHWRRDLDKTLKRVEGLRLAFPGLQTVDTSTGMIGVAANASHP